MYHVIRYFMIVIEKFHHIIPSQIPTFSNEKSEFVHILYLIHSIALYIPLYIFWSSNLKSWLPKINWFQFKVDIFSRWWVFAFYGWANQVRRIPVAKDIEKRSPAAGIVLTSIHTDQQVPLNSGFVGLCLLPQSHLFPDSLGITTTGLNLVPSQPTLSHHGCEQDSPQEHQ